jgi:Type II secretion system (T2SS), protein M
VTARDRTVLMVIGAVVLLAGFWFLALGPKRKDEKALNDKIAQAQQRLDTARQQASAAAAARKRYDEDYATVAKLGKAVPADDDVASLVYQLDHISTGTHIDFRSIKLNASGSSSAPAAPAAAQAAAVASANGTTTTPSGSSSSSTPSSTSTTSSSTTPAPATGVPATQSAAAGLPPGSSVGSAGFPTMPFSFDFDGSFFDMEHFFEGIQSFASTSGDDVSVHGRLLTVDAFALTASRLGFPRVKASINATAYLVPQDEGLTGGATPQGPGATPASATGSSGSPTAPAAATSIAGGAR